MWKDIIDWEEYYQVNENGDVRNKLTGKEIIGDTNSTGYKRVCLHNKNNTVKRQRFFRHRLVAIHFIDNPLCLKEVNHIDGNKENNHVSNLEWCDRLSNEKHAWETGLKGNNKTNKPVYIKFKNGTERVFESQKQIQKDLGISVSQLQVWLVRGSKTYEKFDIESIRFI